MKVRMSFLMITAVFSFAPLYAEPDTASLGILKLPENVTVELISPERGLVMPAVENGRAELPFGKYRLESWTLHRTDEEGHKWTLSGDLNQARTVNIGDEPVTLDIKTEPIVCDLSISPLPEMMSFSLSLKGPAGERLRVSGDAPGVKQDQLPQPTFVIYNESGSFKKSSESQSQCCGNYNFGWVPPSDVQGPFFIDIKVAGPFKIDFEPKNISEMHAAEIAKQQARHKRQTQLAYLIGCIYVIVFLVIVGVLLFFRTSIKKAAPKEGQRPFLKRLVILLGIFVLLMLLDPLYFFFTGKTELMQTVVQGSSVAAVILFAAFCVWAVRKVRTKWPFVTILLYGLIFVLFVIPIVFVVLIAFGVPGADYSDFGWDETGEFYAALFTFAEPGVFVAWAIILAILAVQASLLIVPVRIKHQRPRPQRGIWWTATVAGLLYTLLLFMAALSVFAAVWGDDIPEVPFWIVLSILPLNWIVWSVVFWLFSRSMEPHSFIRKLMNWLMGGSILELLIAVPSHIIVRHKDVCCAQGLSAAGLTTGLAVIFFAFGPGLYFLYADRIRQKTPNLPPQPEETIGSETPPQ